LGRTFALELAPIRVNVVIAGLIDTPLWDAFPADAREAMFAQVAAGLPVGRVGRPEDVAPTVLHALASPYVTGAILTVDGGGLL
ncbi:MAG: SDR family oxidoreductase, partial [Streptomycetaceae bacterium]|nr:SDR family oxidoreductase [Streptomycetaceae bacterium]